MFIDKKRKMDKKKYIAPRMEEMNLETENVLATSSEYMQIGGAQTPTLGSDSKNSFWDVIPSPQDEK